MQKNKLWMILIPILIIALILGGGYVYLKLNSTPQNVFKVTISKICEAFEREQLDYKTIKGTYNISTNVETENEEVQEIADYLNALNVALDVEMDMENIIIDGNLKVEHQEESLIDANILLQDEKSYVYLRDWFSKYIELPVEDEDFTELKEEISKIATIDTKNIISSVKKELINEISKQEFKQLKTTIMLNENETKVTEYKLNFTKKTLAIFTKELLQNLNNNNDFLTAWGENRNDVVEAITNDIAKFEKMEENADGEEHVLEISIYTKGLLNKFAGLSFKIIDVDGEEAIDILKHNENKYEIACYKISEGEKENKLHAWLENQKQSENKGTLVVTINEDDETQEFTCEYEKQDNGTYFTIKAKIREKELIITGNIIEKGLMYQGKMAFIVESDGTKITLNYEYSMEVNADIKKVDVEDSVPLYEMTEEEQEELVTNIQNSPIGSLIKNYYNLLNDIMEAVNSSLYTMQDEIEDASTQAENDFINSLNKLDNDNTAQDNLPIVTDGKYIVKYIVPETFKVSNYNTKDSKFYTDLQYNTVNVYISKQTSQEYLNSLDEEYILKSSNYTNQQISDIKTHTVNGKDYKYRTIQYNNMDMLMAKVYFAYELDNKTCYIVEVETLQESMQLDDLDKFLQISL